MAANFAGFQKFASNKQSDVLPKVGNFTGGAITVAGAQAMRLLIGGEANIIRRGLPAKKRLLQGRRFGASQNLSPSGEIDLHIKTILFHKRYNTPRTAVMCEE